MFLSLFATKIAVDSAVDIFAFHRGVEISKERLQTINSKGTLRNAYRSKILTLEDDLVGSGQRLKRM